MSHLIGYDEKTFATEYYVLMIFISAIHRGILYGMFLAIMGFFAKISDPVSIYLYIIISTNKTWPSPSFLIERYFPFQVVGGTNMTFFNTLANLGNMWPDTFFLWFVDVITYKVGYYFKA